jgi:hypothetical protein
MPNSDRLTLVLGATGKTGSRGSRPSSDVQKATGAVPTSFADFARRTAAAWAMDGGR